MGWEEALGRSPDSEQASGETHGAQAEPDASPSGDGAGPDGGAAGASDQPQLVRKRKRKRRAGVTVAYDRRPARQSGAVSPARPTSGARTSAAATPAATPAAAVPAGEPVDEPVDDAAASAAPAETPVAPPAPPVRPAPEPTSEPEWGAALGFTDGALEPTSVLSQAADGLGQEQRVRKKKRDVSNKRRDIQGLRAVAVIAVVVNHLFDHPQGGFLGVDVFFVISGFLITSLLLREGNARGSISLVGFYKRRIRRLFPAALVVIVLTVIAAQLTFLTPRAKSVRTDGIWAALFGANWREIDLNTDYFASLGPVSPLQHYWSLSVEEQFYLVWPLALLLAFLVCRRLFARRSNATVVVGAAAGAVLTIPSLVYAFANTGPTHATVAYFSTFSRAWELGLGAVLAVLSAYMRGRKAVLTAMSIGGLVVVGISLFVINQSAVPVPGALLPCLGTGLCLMAWTTTAAAWNPLLTNPVANYLGDISYSVYLVHFPVIIIGGALITDRSVAYYFTILLLILGLSVLLFHGLENPIRESNWLLPKGTPRRSAKRRPRQRRIARNGLLGGVAAVLASLAVYALVIGTPSTANPYADRILEEQLRSATTTALPDVPTSASEVAPGAPETVSDLQTELKQALLATSFPDLNPGLGQQTTIGGPGCAKSPLPADQCTWGNASAPHTIYLVGDSTSVAYLNSFITITKLLPDWKVRLAAGDGCPFTSHPVDKTDGNANSATCPTRNEQVVQEINSVKPDLVVVTSGQGDSSITGPETEQVQKITGGAQQIVVLPAPPHMKDPLECATTVSKPSDCVTPMPSEYEGWLTNERAVATAVGGKFIDPSAWFCAVGLCPAFASDVPMMRDSVHQTTNYAAHISLVLFESLRQLEILPAP